MSHKRLTPAAQTAAADLYEHYNESIVDRLRAIYPYVDPQVLADAAVDAILELALDPERYDPGTGAFVRTFLISAARAHLRNPLRGHKRRVAREAKVAVAESASTDRDPSDEAADAELVERGLSVAESETEREFLRLMCKGETDREPYARVLGVRHLPTAEQDKVIKRMRDRLNKRLRRMGIRLSGREDHR